MHNYTDAYCKQPVVSSYLKRVFTKSLIDNKLHVINIVVVFSSFSFKLEVTMIFYRNILFLIKDISYAWLENEGKK